MKVVGVIPARYGSSRFPGKPLADICGKPMIWWVYQKIKQINNLDDIFVATDHREIMDECQSYHIPSIMTSDKHPTGVDRLAEVAAKVAADYYILVQGDEPLIESTSIQKMVDKVRVYQEKKSVYTFKTRIKNPVDVVNNTVIKIVTDINDNVLFASRSPIPYPKANINFDYFKSVGIYSYSQIILKQYPRLKKGPLEYAEDHDFMRLLENGINIKAFEHDTNTISVDTPKDLLRVIEIMEVENNVDFKK